MSQLQVAGHRSQVSRVKTLFFIFVSGVSLALPFCGGRLWIFAWFGFVPLFFAIQDKTPAKAFILSYFTGIIFWSITVYWLIHVTLLGQILLILYLALYFGFFGLFFSAIRWPEGRGWASDSPSHYLLSVIHYIFIPSLWVFLEYLRAHLLTGFGWALLGYSQYLNLPVIQIADLFGAYGVSLVVMMGNVAVYSAFSLQLSAFSKIKKCLIFALSFSIILAYGYYQLSRKPKAESRKLLKISLIQGNIPQELKWAFGSQPLILDRYSQLTKEAALATPDIIIWPEASSPGFVGEEEDAWIIESIFSLAGETKTPLLFGTVVKEGGKYFNSALLINKEGKLSGRYDKLHLVPFGEYIPLKTIFKFLATVVPIGDFTPGKEYVLFKLPVASDQLPGDVVASQVTGRRSQVTFSVLICFEDTIPELSRNFVRKGAQFLVNITNDAWFGNTSASYQHLAASVFRAVENRTPLVRAANTGVSCVIDFQGRIAAKVSQGAKDIFVPGIKTERIMLGGRHSLYSNIGDIFILACFALTGFCGIILKKLETRNQKPERI